MTCRAFEAAWNELLDAETSEGRASAEAQPAVAARLRGHEQAAAAHARNCPACGIRHGQYQTLRRALRASLAAPPSLPRPSPAVAERVLLGVRRGTGARTRRRLLPLAVALATAAGLLVLARVPRNPALPPREPAPHANEAPRLGDAVADATAATWDLARATTEPAARLGRGILMVATGTDHPDGVPLAEGVPVESSLPALPIPLVLRSAGPARAGPGWLRGVGDELTAGVRPLSVRAREAFGFLRAPALGRGGVPPRRPPVKGA